MQRRLSSAALAGSKQAPRVWPVVVRWRPVRHQVPDGLASGSTICVMAKTVQTPASPEPKLEDRPTWTELLRTIRERPTHKPYTGPSIAQLIRSDRDAH